MDVLHKAVGVGPDCFADYVYAVPQLAERLLVQFENQKLTCAHNEWLTILVNTGAFGLLCYVGLLASAAVRCLKKAGEQTVIDGQTGDNTQLLLYACAIGLLAYTAHNMVSFQQILNTPYFFIVLGMGEGLVRRTEQKL
jgi:O-antigen ligase